MVEDVQHLLHKGLPLAMIRFPQIDAHHRHYIVHGLPSLQIACDIGPSERGNEPQHYRKRDIQNCPYRLTLLYQQQRFHFEC
jgi:hypothetical protein